MAVKWRVALQGGWSLAHLMGRLQSKGSRERDVHSHESKKALLLRHSLCLRNIQLVHLLLLLPPQYHRPHLAYFLLCRSADHVVKSSVQKTTTYSTPNTILSVAASSTPATQDSGPISLPVINIINLYPPRLLLVLLIIYMARSCRASSFSRLSFISCMPSGVRIPAGARLVMQIGPVLASF